MVQFSRLYVVIFCCKQHGGVWHNVSNGDLCSKLRGMNEFITATASILTTGRKKPIVGKKRRQSVVNSKGKFRNIRTAYGRFLNSNDWIEKPSSPAARVPLQSPPFSFYTFSTAHVYLTFPRNEMCGHGRLYDRLRLCGNVHFCHQRSCAIIWEPCLIFKIPAFTRFSIYAELVAPSTQNTSRAVTNTPYPLACL